MKKVVFLSMFIFLISCSSNSTRPFKTKNPITTPEACLRLHEDVKEHNLKYPENQKVADC